MLLKKILGFLLIILKCVHGMDLSCSLRTNSSLPRLRKYNADPSLTTVSGISNGGGYAVHISFIYSSLIRGAGIFAASPYPMMYMLGIRQGNAIFDINPYYPYIDRWSAEGGIDSTDNLKGFKAYVYMGLRDLLIHPRIVRNVIDQYNHYGANTKDVTTSVVSGHCMPTRNKRNNDPALGWLQGICNVGFEGVYDMFSHFYGDQDDYVKPPDDVNTPPTGELFKVDISEFYPGCNPELYSMGPTAWIYVPKKCSNNKNGFTDEEGVIQNNKIDNGNGIGSVKCKLHLAFHGYMLHWRASLVANSHNAYVEDAGYLQAADANNIILLFPESNWRGYDIIGFTSRTDFVLKKGVQNLGIKKMIQRITDGI